MTKFKLIENLSVLNELILPQGSIIVFDENNEILINTNFGPLRFNKEKLENIIEEYQEIDIKTSVIEDTDSTQWYRLQLDVKTTKSKAIEIEKFLRKTINDML
jgi:pyridoxine 5'-phosphate synthase PdxJ